MHCTLIKDQIRQKFNSDTIFIIYKEEEYIERYETDDDTYKQKVDSHTIQSKNLSLITIMYLDLHKFLNRLTAYGTLI